jgi:Ca-activated chloride channel family protein
MQFLWPLNLWRMLALPALVALYLWLLRRRTFQAVRLPSLEVVRAAAGRPWRRHVPPALVLLALAALLLALARPIATVTLPGARTTILLALDVSLSMRVTDVKPTRMAAAQEAAKAFLAEVPRRIDVGLVTFAGSARRANALRSWPRSMPSRCSAARPWAAPSSCACPSSSRITASTWAR